VRSQLLVSVYYHENECSLDFVLHASRE